MREIQQSFRGQCPVCLGNGVVVNTQLGCQLSYTRESLTT